MLVLKEILSIAIITACVSNRDSFWVIKNVEMGEVSPLQRCPAI